MSKTEVALVCALHTSTWAVQAIALLTRVFCPAHSPARLPCTLTIATISPRFICNGRRDYDSPCPYTEIGAQELAGRCVCVMLDRDCAEEQDKGRNFLGRAERAYFSAAASAIQAQLSVLRFFFLLELSRKLIYLNHVIMRCSQFQNVLRRLYLHLLCFSFAVSPSFPLQRICGGHASVF